VDRSALELAQAVTEPFLLQLVPGHAGLEMNLVLADAPVAGDEPEAELGQVAGLDLPHVAGDQVVVKQLQRARGFWQEPWQQRGRIDAVVTNALLRGPPHRSGRFLDRAQPALLPRPARPARLARSQRGAGRARRDDLVPLGHGQLDRPPRGADPERRSLRSLPGRPAPPRARGELAAGRERARRL